MFLTLPETHQDDSQQTQASLTKPVSELLLKLVCNYSHNQRLHNLTIKSLLSTQENCLVDSLPSYSQILKYFVMTLRQKITKDNFLNVSLCSFLWKGKKRMTIWG